MALKDTVKEIQKLDDLDNIVFPDVEDSLLELTSKRIFCIYGDKGTGKSALAYGLMKPKDSCLVLSFDRKSASPLEIPAIKNMSLDVKIVGPTMYYDKMTDPSWLATSLTTVKYVHHLIDYAKDHDVDWIILDCTEVLKEIAEMGMRARFKCGVFGGVQIPYWKERKRILDVIHDLAFKLAKKGVIYTFYPRVEETFIKDGIIIDARETPQWIGSTLRETDIKIKTYAKESKGSWQFFANIESSKDLLYKGGEYDVTDASLFNIISILNK